ncbi:MAG TPA: MGMT family protein [Parasegetibacter sp.]|jgi:methylated-DNA-protein-cysteine methyltransferase-like protein
MKDRKPAIRSKKTVSAPRNKQIAKKQIVGKPEKHSEKSENEPSFFELVHEVARQIPKGRVTSYGAIGRCLGSGLTARMVGWAMNASHIASSPVPAHRVVNRKGILSGKMHFATPTQMQELLEAEGVKVKDDQVVNFNEIFWDPSIELAL